MIRVGQYGPQTGHAAVWGAVAYGEVPRMAQKIVAIPFLIKFILPSMKDRKERDILEEI